MMKKSIIIAIFCFFTFPFLTDAITLGEYEQKLNNYIAQANANKAAINKTETEIKSTNTNISNIQQEMKDMLREVEVLRQEVSQFNDEIKAKDSETKKVIEYYQLSQSGNNSAFEYAFGASDVTDLIYRLSIIEQLIEYNNNKIIELNEMIDKNTSREKEINTKEKQLQNKQVQLEGYVVELGEEKSSLETAGVSVAQQVKIYRELVTGYKKQGCKSSDRIGIDCAVHGEAGVFRRPTRTGYITQEFGYTRPGYLHRALDIGSSLGSSTPLYSIGNGRITSIYKDSHGALCVTIEYYSSAKRSWYTALYAHLSRYGNIYVGKQVTSNDIIGYMGNTGYSFGVHLHIEVIPCRLFNWSDSNCSSWSRYTNYVNRLVSSGYKGPRSLIHFPAYRVAWSTR